MAAPNFRTGMEASEAAAARSSFARTEFLSIEDGKHADLRFITDHNQVITVNQHNNCSTRHAPEGYSGKWPQKMSGVCRMDQNEGVRVFPDFPDCFLCNQHAETGDKDFKATARGWGLAVVRKVKMENGRAVGMEDEMVEIENDGKKFLIPKIVICNFSWQNFWSGLSAITQLHQTWLDRDIRVVRKGTGLDTDYNFAAMDPVDAETGSGTTVTTRFDLRNGDHLARYSGQFAASGTPFPNIGEIVFERANDDFYARFFDTRMAQPVDQKGGETKGGGAETSKPADSGPSQADLAAMAARVAGHPVEPAAAAPTEAPAEATTAEAPGVPSFG